MHKSSDTQINPNFCCAIGKSTHTKILACNTFVEGQIRRSGDIGEESKEEASLRIEEVTIFTRVVAALLLHCQARVSLT